MLELLIEASRPLYFRGKRRILQKIGPRGGTRVCRVFGAEFHLDLDDFGQRLIYLGTYEQPESKIVQGWLHPGMTFVDAGANFGYYTALASQAVASAGRVIAFEPSPIAHQAVCDLIARNRLSNVTLLQCGLSDQPATVGLYSGRGFHHHSPTMVAHANTDVVQVPVDTLDRSMERLGVESIDVLKIDVEGFEPRVLRGAAGLLAKGRIRYVLCEFCEHWLQLAGSSTEELQAMFLRAGFREIHRIAENRFFEHV